jgi:sporadic carbohydrate cluster 2OG-Fe(II) oxygenase/sporadic carbohydrate cluster protein (TIGR04323 family)
MFDAQVYDYDHIQYQFSDIVLKCIQKYYPGVEELNLLHKIVPYNSVGSLAKKVGKDLADTDFYERFDNLIAEYVLPLVPSDLLVQRFGNIRINVPNQDQSGTVLPFHQGQWVGNGLGLRTIWLPFTECFESNSLQIIQQYESRLLTKQCLKYNWSCEDFEEHCLNSCKPVNINTDQFILFTQENIHGAVPNRTGYTRISIDVRVLLRDGQPHRKWPGSYFRILGDSNIQSRNVEISDTDNVVMYAEYEGFKTQYIDLYFQTLTVKEYCNRMGYIFPHQTGDNEGRNHVYLEYLINQGKVDHILMFSIFSLPDDIDRRNYIMNLSLDKGVKLHFANEEFVLDNQEVLDKIEYIRNFTKDWSNPVNENKFMVF